MKTNSIFKPFPKGITLEHPIFDNYKRDLGVISLSLQNQTHAMTIANNIVAVSQKISAPLIGSLHAPIELAALYELACGLHDTIPMPDGHVINCGTFRGSNACAIASALKHIGFTTPILTIDPFNYAHTKYYPNDTTDLVFLHHKQLIEHFGLQNLIASVYHTDLEYLEHFWAKPIRIAVIDTTHSYPQTQQEIQALTAHIPTGGWFISHDFMPENEGVVQALHEFLHSTRRQYKLLNTWAYLFIQFLT